MGRMLCAVRGGPEGYPTQDRAIALARERGDEVLFLVVLDPSFLGAPAGSAGPDPRPALLRLGHNLLTRAAERARRAGLTVRTLLREGSPREQIKAVAREEGVTTVVLGRPQGKYDQFVAAELEALAEEIERETGAQVWIL
ncbi:MAG: universal stress protein [Chloroflexia bacterium]